MQPLKGALHVGGAGQVIETVQTADGSIHRAVQIQLRHGLMQKDGGDAIHGAAFVHGGGQHILTVVHGDQLVAPGGEDPCHGTGAAGKVQHRMHRNTAAAEQLLDKIRPLFILYVAGQRVVAGGQRVIGGHSFDSFSAFSFSSSSFIFSSTLS